MTVFTDSEKMVDSQKLDHNSYDNWSCLWIPEGESVVVYSNESILLFTKQSFRFTINRHRALLGASPVVKISLSASFMPIDDLKRGNV